MIPSGLAKREIDSSSTKRNTRQQSLERVSVAGWKNGHAGTGMAADEQGYGTRLADRVDRSTAGTPGGCGGTELR
jgi:hypothetical protein